MKFSELDEATKDQLREKHRYDRVMDDEWWGAMSEAAPNAPQRNGLPGPGPMWARIVASTALLLTWATLAFRLSALNQAEKGFR